MTQAPHILRGAREGWPFGKAPHVEDSLWSALTDSYYEHADGRDRREPRRRSTASRAKSATRTRSRASSAGPRRTRSGALQRRDHARRDRDEEGHRRSSQSTSIRVRRRRSRSSRSFRPSSRRTASSRRATRRASATAPRALVLDDGRIREGERPEAARARRVVGRRRRRPDASWASAPRRRSRARSRARS